MSNSVIRTGCLLLVLLPIMALAQGKHSLRSITSAGMAAGESVTKPIYQFSGGIQYGKYFTGIGFGYDQYRFNSIPVFADWRMSFGKRQVLFVYGNLGYNFPAPHQYAEDFSKALGDKLIGGYYMDGGLGCRFPLGPLHRFLFSAGYSRKNMDHKTETVIPCLVPPCPVDINRYQYKLGRVITRLSWEFGR